MILFKHQKPPQTYQPPTPQGFPYHPLFFSSPSPHKITFSKWSLDRDLDSFHAPCDLVTPLPTHHIHLPHLLRAIRSLLFSLVSTKASFSKGTATFLSLQRTLQSVSVSSPSSTHPLGLMLMNIVHSFTWTRSVRHPVKKPGLRIFVTFPPGWVSPVFMVPGLEPKLTEVLEIPEVPQWRTGMSPGWESRERTATTCLPPRRRSMTQKVQRTRRPCCKASSLPSWWVGRFL